MSCDLYTCMGFGVYVYMHVHMYIIYIHTVFIIQILLYKIMSFIYIRYI